MTERPRTTEISTLTSLSEEEDITIQGRTTNGDVCPIVLSTPLMRADSAPIEWTIGTGPVPYLEAVTRMEARVDAITRGQAKQEVWLLEHPPLYTAGTSSKDADLLEARFPVFRT